MKPVNERLQDALLRRAALNSRAENATLRDLLVDWRRAVQGMLYAVRSRGDIFTKERALLGVPAADRHSRLQREVLVPLRALIDAAMDRMARRLAADLPAFVRRELSDTPEILQRIADAALPGDGSVAAAEAVLSEAAGVTFDSVPTQQIAVLLATPAGGSFFQTGLERLGQQLFGQARGVLLGGLLQGRGVEPVARQLQGVLGGARWQAERIVRSEYVRAGNQANLLTFERNKRLLDGVRWVLTLDRRTCVVQGFARVKTSRGWVPIRDVKVGDHVLTHEDRYARVSAVAKQPYTGPVVTIKLPGRAVPGNGSVSLTADHEVYRRRNGGDWKWVRADMLRAGDELLVPGHACVGEGCETVVPEWRTLCPSCVVRRRNAVYWKTPGARALAAARSEKQFTPQVRRRASRALKKRWTDPVYRAEKTAASKMTARRQWADPTWAARKRAWLVNQGSLGYGFQKGWRLKDPERAEALWKKAHVAIGKNARGGTWGERKLAWLLGRLGIDFRPQHYMPAGGTRHWVDFYLPKQNVVIEVDGAYYHGGREKADADRAARIQATYGCTFVRFTDVDVKKAMGEKVVPTLQRLQAGCLAAVPVKRVVRKKIRGNAAARGGFGRAQIVYDLTVEGGHSFFVNGIAVHNCVLCASLDGKVWADPAKARIPVQSTHPNCRCTLVAVVKAATALGLPPGTRASFTGQVPATVTYRDWLPRQSAAFQREVLGPTRYRLWRSGVLKLGDFVTAAGIKPVSALPSAKVRPFGVAEEYGNVVAGAWERPASLTAIRPVFDRGVPVSISREIAAKLPREHWQVVLSQKVLKKVEMLPVLPGVRRGKQVVGWYDPVSKQAFLAASPSAPATFVHEFGHAVDRAIRGTGGTRWSFERVSEYAKTNAQEAFAEAYAMFASPRGRTIMRERFPGAYAYMERVYGAGRPAGSAIPKVADVPASTKPLAPAYMKVDRGPADYLSDEEKLAEKFARSETPAARAARIKSKKVPPEDVERIRRALGMEPLKPARGARR